MAAPHVAGLVNYVQCEFGIKHPRIIREKLEELATKGVVVDAGGSSPNRIVYNGSGF